MIEHDSEKFLVSYKTKGRLPSLPFVNIKNDILGKNYELSLVCITKKQAIDLNTTYRQKTYTPNILSFPLDETNGEIFLHLPTIKKEHNSFELSHNGYITYLFIHGCLHLKGYEHSNEMEKLEQKYKKKYTVV